MQRFHPCPKCNRRLEISGSVLVDDRELAVFQCDECTRPIDLGDGDSIETALTFCVDDQGNLLDPNSPDQQLHLP